MAQNFPVDIPAKRSGQPVGTVEIRSAFALSGGAETLPVQHVEDGVLFLMPDKNGYSAKFNCLSGKEIFDKKTLSSQAVVTPRRMSIQTFHQCS